MDVKQASGPRLAQVRPSPGMEGCSGAMDPRKMLVTAQMRQEQGEGHYTPEEHCPTGDQRSGGQELRRGLQATQTPREPWRGAGRPYHCTVEMGLPMPMWCV